MGDLDSTNPDSGPKYLRWTIPGAKTFVERKVKGFDLGKIVEVVEPLLRTQIERVEKQKAQEANRELAETLVTYVRSNTDLPAGVRLYARTADKVSLSLNVELSLDPYNAQEAINRLSGQTIQTGQNNSLWSYNSCGARWAILDTLQELVHDGIMPKEPK